MNRFALPLALASVAVLGPAATTPAQPQLPVPFVTESPALPPVKALTVREFACTEFRPGTYSVYLVHPCTNCPVKVCFSLPVCPRRVRTSSTTLELRWGVLGCKAVVIRFLPNGTVSVRG